MLRALAERTWLFSSLLAFFFVASSAYGSIHTYSSIPFWDMWDGFVLFITRLQDGDYGAFFTRHVDHVIFWTNSLFWADFKLFEGNVGVLIAANYVLVAVLCGEFAYLIHRLSDGQAGKRLWLNVVLVIVALLFSWAQKENLTWAFQSQMFLTLIVPLAGFIFFWRSVETGKTGYFALSLALGAASVGAMANGVFALPILFLCALRCKTHWSRPLAIALVAAAVFAWFFSGYSPASSQKGGLHVLVEQPLAAMRYVLVYLGSPTYYALGHPGLDVCAVVGGLVALVSSVLLARLLLQRELGASLPAGAILLYCLLTAVATASGRLTFGTEQAVSSRYTTSVLTAWSAVITLGAAWFAQAWPRRFALFSSALVLAPLACVPLQLHAFDRAPDFRFDKAVAGLAIALQVHDQKQIEFTFPWVNILFELSEKANQRQILMFGEPRYAGIRASIGKPTNKLPQGACDVTAVQSEAIPDETRFRRVSMQLTMPSSAVWPQYVDLLTDDGRLAGRLIVDTFGSIPSPHSEKKAATMRGYVLAGEAPSALTPQAGTYSCKLTP